MTKMVYVVDEVDQFTDICWINSVWTEEQFCNAYVHFLAPGGLDWKRYYSVSRLILGKFKANAEIKNGVTVEEIRKLLSVKHI